MAASGALQNSDAERYRQLQTAARSSGAEYALNFDKLKATRQGFRPI
jgi:hypothetical protein